MNTLKQLGLVLLALSFSNAVLAKRGGDSSAPAPIPATPVSSSQSALITSQPMGGTTYALYFMDKTKLLSTPAQELAILNGQLGLFGLSPCLVTADLNATPIKCGSGLVEFGTNELYSYGRPFNLQKLPINLDKGVKQVFGANFRSPVGLVPGDSVGRAVHVHFNQPVAQFAMNFESGQALAPSIGAVQFIVGTGASAISYTQTLTPGTTQWAGLQVPVGFTDLVVVPLNGATQAFVTDQISVVTKAQFIP